MRNRADVLRHEFIEAKKQVIKLQAENAELKSWTVSSVAEQQDVYYSLQRQLDDSYERLSEFELATNRVELDKDRIELGLIKDRKRIEEELKLGLSNAAVTKAELAETLRRMKQIGIGYNERIDHIKKLEKDIEDSKLSHLHASLEADRAHVHGKEEARRDGFQIARDLRRDIVKNKQEYLEKKAMDTLARGSSLGSALATQSKGVEKLLLRCDSALTNQNTLLRSLDLIDSTGNVMASKIKRTQKKVNDLYDVLNRQIQNENEIHASMLEIDGDQNVGVGRELFSDDGDNNNPINQKDEVGTKTQRISSLILLEEDLKRERVLLDERRRKLDGLNNHFDQLERLCNSAMSNLTKCLTHKNKSFKQLEQHELPSNHREEEHQNKGLGGVENDVNLTSKVPIVEGKLMGWELGDSIPSDLSMLSKSATISLIRFLLSKLHQFRMMLREAKEVVSIRPTAMVTSPSHVDMQSSLEGSSSLEVEPKGIEGTADFSKMRGVDKFTASTTSLSQFSSCLLSSNQRTKSRTSSQQLKSTSGDNMNQASSSTSHVSLSQQHQPNKSNSLTIKKKDKKRISSSRDLVLPPIPKFTLRK